MNPFDHVGVLYSFIVSLGLAQVMTTVGLLVQQRARVSFSAIYAIWLLIGLLAHLDLWLQLWTYRSVTEWSILKILLLLAWAGALFMMTTLLQPPRPEDGERLDLRAFHLRQRQGYVIAFAAGLLISIVADITTDPTYTAEDIVLQLVAVPVLMLPWSALAVLVARPWAQWTGALGTLAVCVLSLATMEQLTFSAPPASPSTAAPPRPG